MHRRIGMRVRFCKTGDGVLDLVLPPLHATAESSMRM
jgi:hypothetical protein